MRTKVCNGAWPKEAGQWANSRASAGMSAIRNGRNRRASRRAAKEGGQQGEGVEEKQGGEAGRGRAFDICFPSC